MEAGTITPEAPEAVEDRAPDELTAQQLYQFSTWLHIGPGAQECEESESGECQNRLHFHGWCRLPNQLQVRDIRQKAKAAKARRARQLRDPQTDSYEILEDDMDALGRIGEAGRGQLVDDLLGKSWFADYTEALNDVAEMEDDGEKLYDTIDEDDKRLKVLLEMDAEQRPVEELEELQRHISAYNDAVEARLAEVQRPRREALEDRDINDLIDLIRAERIDAAAMEEFMATYSQWEWYICTYLTPNGRRRFGSFEEMEGAAPEVIDGLKVTFDDLERSFADGVGKGS